MSERCGHHQFGCPRLTCVGWEFYFSSNNEAFRFRAVLLPQQPSNEKAVQDQVLQLYRNAVIFFFVGGGIYCTCILYGVVF